MTRPRIVVVGSVNADMVVKAERLPAPGETVTGGQFVMAAGGKGANQAVAAARLGADVTLVAKTGCDMFGDEAVENYQREGIATDLILRDPEELSKIAADRKSSMMLLPYGIPIAIGSIGYFAYMGLLI